MQKQIFEKKKLLDTNGLLNDPGYATSMIFEYDRKDIKHKAYKIKEWDYYFIGNDHHGVCLTIADNGYMAIASATILDFEKKSQITKTIIKPFSLGKLNLPKSSEEGISEFKNRKAHIRFEVINQKRVLHCTFKKFRKKDTLEVLIELEETNKDSMVIAIPFHKPTYFYYNQKINHLRPKGYMTLGNTQYIFDDTSYGLLDWGRGVWTYKNTWYWSSMSDMQDGKRIGFNLGYGFGDTKFATENVFYYDGKQYKLKDIEFKIPQQKNKDSFMDPWVIEDKEKHVFLQFTPVLNRSSHTSMGIIYSLQDQVFGYFSGYIKTDQDTFEIKKCFGFAEKVQNKW